MGNYGISLIILTAIVKLALFPLYVKQIKSTANMQELQPKMQEIQKKYAHDQQKMNEAMQELYAKEKFNPLGGCLPMLIQFPIIMGLFALLRNPMQYLKSEDMLFAVHESFSLDQGFGSAGSLDSPNCGSSSDIFLVHHDSAAYHCCRC